MSRNFLNRREFLKLSSASLLGLFLSEYTSGFLPKLTKVIQGRVLATSLVVRETPKFTGKKLLSVKKDTIVDIDEELFAGSEGDYNRHWFHLKDKGFVYSGWIQPVKTLTNPMVAQIPTTGILGEITVPYTDSAFGINSRPSMGPRLYYLSTHWITDTVIDDQDGSSWYKAYDAATQGHYFISTAVLRLFTETELAPISPQVPAQDKHIEIYLNRQLLLAYEWDTLVYIARVATGRPNFETPTGNFQTFHKRPSYHMFGGADEFSIFDLPGVPWDSYITDTGVALHGTYWHNDFGHPHSHGCINMLPDDAKWVYRWTIPNLLPGERLALQPGYGTSVQVRPA